MSPTTKKTETLAGISSFLATMYIIIVNPSILSQAGMPFDAVLTATVLLSFFCSLMMGLYAKNPIVDCSGMGMNAFFTFTAVKGMGDFLSSSFRCSVLGGCFFLAFIDF